jgi:transcriptional regulator with XRE-family HTH domain
MPSSSRSPKKILFGRQLQRARLAKKLTQKRLAEKSMIKLSMIRMYEQGRSLPSAGRLVTLCQILEVPPDSLIPQDWTIGPT